MTIFYSHKEQFLKWIEEIQDENNSYFEGGFGLCYQAAVLNCLIANKKRENYVLILGNFDPNSEDTISHAQVEINGKTYESRGINKKFYPRCIKTFDFCTREELKKQLKDFFDSFNYLK